MALAEKPVLNQVAVEIRYLRGIVFLDKCGSLTLKLQRELDEPFESSGLPTMEFGELKSESERISVRYGSKALNVTQAWPLNFARVEQLTPGTWQEVVESLAVGHSVSRCGARFWWLWSVASLDEGEERLAESGLLAESDEWEEIFGLPAKRTWSFESSVDKGGSLRAAMATVETKLAKGAELPADLVSVVPKYAVMLDLDYAYPGREPFPLNRVQLKEFLRSSWELSQVAVKKTGELLRGKP